MSYTARGDPSTANSSGGGDELPRIPEQSPAEWGCVLLLVAASLLYLRLFRSYTNLNADEGIVLQGAQRVLEGQVPYRDFFSFYTPGSYYLLALLFKIFGTSILVGREMLVFFGGVFSALTYLLARRVCSRWSALLASYLLLTVCLPTRFFVLHNWDSTFWVYLALYSAIRLVEKPRAVWAFLTGSFVAATLLTEQSKGFGLALGLACGFLVIWHSEFGRHALRRRNLVLLLAGTTWPAVVTLGYFAVEHATYTALADWLWPLRHYSAANRLPYGYSAVFAGQWQASREGPFWERAFVILTLTPRLVVSLLPFLGLGWAAFHARRVWRGKVSARVSSYYVMIGAVAAGLLVATVATGRADFHHLVYMAPPVFVVLAWVLDARGVRSSRLAEARPLLVVYLLLPFTVYGMLLLQVPLTARCQFDTRRGLMLTSTPDTVLEYVDEHVPTGARMMVYPYQPLYSYLSATVSPTDYDYLQPGMHTAAQFQQALSQFAADRTPAVLFDPSFGSDKVPSDWPATPPSALGRDVVADYIVSHYRVCKVLTAPGWRFFFMLRRELKCP